LAGGLEVCRSFCDSETFLNPRARPISADPLVNKSHNLEIMMMMQNRGEGDMEDDLFVCFESKASSSGDYDNGFCKAIHPERLCTLFPRLTVAT
jgi:hypothetical protein